ncbi:MAG TPA: LytTR family DNA-binding domain-containing protein [Sphingomonas sp.]|uniref:LytR/AlgR family response regulator transcription factor n=1 Tax=Sphingomonas sp. TaxID=28214 RepID=UPI002C48BFA4|nr:LytTR family DNA-binding domain-containing protein [Sphingomonas sp.]HMI18097.1 LytTR family DNA-binding domain-containing protein [Sphingomonas sp.]
MKVIVCDDEFLAVERLERMLSRIDDIVIAGSAQNGRDALALIAEHAPDALFLDIEMPALDGFDVVEALAADPNVAPPLIVFVTAFPQFAAHAFDTGAVDFLIKPVRFARLEMAVARVRDVIDQRDARRRLADLAGQLSALRAEGNDNVGGANEIWVHRRAERIRVDLDAVELVRAEGEYVRLFVGEQSFLHRASIGSIAARLDPGRFMRVHRSYVVRLDLIAKIRRKTAGGYSLLLVGGEEIPLGRLYRADLLRHAQG